MIFNLLMLMFWHWRLLIFSIISNCEASFGSGEEEEGIRSVICRLAKAPFLPKDG